VRKIVAKLIYNKPTREIILFMIPLTLLGTLFILGFSLEGSQQFSLLAQAFLHGQTNFLHPIGGLGQDPVLYNGKIYWDEGPFPALILLPFVSLFSLFHLFFFQGYIKWLLMLGIVYFVYRIARILSYSKEDSWILMFGFTLGSVFVGVAGVSSSWFFAQIVTTFLLLWSLYEFYTRKRWWLLGLICAFMLATRPTAAAIIIFFGLELWALKHRRVTKIKLLAALIAPAIGAVMLLGLYNFVRFHSALNDGNTYQLLYPASANARAYGIFNPIHIPTNFYSAFLSAPLPVMKSAGSWILKAPYLENNEYGISLFVTSPYMLYFFTKKWSTYGAPARRLLFATAVSCLGVLSYFGIGLDQFGYRYSLDFFPGLFVVFMIIYKANHPSSLSRGMKFLLLGSGVINFYLMCTFLG
jgi:hypothetical protein